MVFAELVLAGSIVATLPLLMNITQCYRAILNDAKIVSLDPALSSRIEILYAYPGFWALFWYRLSHALWHLHIPILSAVWPRLTMGIVRYATAIDIHPEAQISSDGILIDHGAGLVVGATAIIGGGVTLYHGVTLGGTGKRLPAGAKRHPTLGDRVVIGAGAKILGDIVIGNDVLVGANSVVTKAVPANHTAVGIPARVLCHGSSTGKDVTGAAICDLHQRLRKVEKDSAANAKSEPIQLSSTPSTPTTAVSTKNVPAVSAEKPAESATKTLPVVVRSAAATTAIEQSQETASQPENAPGGDLSASRSEERAETVMHARERAVGRRAKEIVEQGRRIGNKVPLSTIAEVTVAEGEGSEERSEESSAASAERAHSPATAKLLVQEEGSIPSAPTGPLISARYGSDKLGYMHLETEAVFDCKRYMSSVLDARSRARSAKQEVARRRRAVDGQTRISAVDEIMYGLRAIGEETLDEW